MKPRKRLLWIPVVVICLVAAADFTLIKLYPRYKFNLIVVHHSASRVDDFTSIRNFHRNERGWRDAAYHLILSNGSTSVPVGHLEATSRYKNLSYSTASSNWYVNVRGLHGCVVGTHDQDPVPAQTKWALGSAIRLLQERFGVTPDAVRLHHEVNGTICPGQHIKRRELLDWVKQGPGLCDANIVAQQRRVIAGGRFSWHSFSRRTKLILLGLHAVAACAVGLFSAWILFWTFRRRRHTTC